LYGKRTVRVPIKDELVSSKVVNSESGEEYPLIKEPKIVHGTEIEPPFDPNSTDIQKPKKSKNDKIKSRLS